MALISCKGLSLSLIHICAVIGEVGVENRLIHRAVPAARHALSDEVAGTVTQARAYFIARGLGKAEDVYKRQLLTLYASLPSTTASSAS